MFRVLGLGKSVLGGTCLEFRVPGNLLELGLYPVLLKK